MEKQHEIESLSWQQIEQACLYHVPILKKRVLEIENPRICAIARGGLIAATILSHQLGIPIVNFISARTYSGKKNLGTEFDQSAAIPKKAIGQTLFVDDILDTGSTLEAVLGMYPGAKFFIPIAKSTGWKKHKEHLVVQPFAVYPDSMWVKFPWEVS